MHDHTMHQNGHIEGPIFIRNTTPETPLPFEAAYNPLANERDFFKSLQLLRELSEASGVQGDWQLTLERFQEDYARLKQPNRYKEQLQRENIQGAFVVHSRSPHTPATMWQDDEGKLADTSRHYPALNKSAITEANPQLNELYNAIASHIPPTVIGHLGMISPEDETRLIIMASAITPSLLSGGFTRGVRLAQPRALAAAQALDAFGIETSGWGAMHGAFTNGGLHLKEAYPQHLITTGHTATTVAILGTLERLREEVGIGAENMRVGVIGAMGSIGGSVSEVLKHQSNLFGQPNPIILQIDKRFPQGLSMQNGTYHASSVDDEGLISENGYVGGVNILVSATSAPQPFLNLNHLKGIQGVVDDSQPTGVSWNTVRRAYKKNGTITTWPLFMGKDETTLFNDFDFGLLPGTEFGCAIEAMAATYMKARGQSLGYEPTGKVTPEKVYTLMPILDQLGISPDGLQAYGRKARHY